MRGGYGTSNHGTLADRAGVPSGPHASQVAGLMSKLDSFSQSASDTESARSKGHRSFGRAAGTGGLSPYPWPAPPYRRCKRLPSNARTTAGVLLDIVEDEVHITAD